MIITLSELKTLLGITGTDHDAQITALIPLAVEQVAQYCKTDFLVASVSGGDNQYDYQSEAIFKTADRTLQLPGVDLSGNNWQVGMDVRIRGSNFNKSFPKILEIDSDKFTFSNDDSITDENSGDKTVYVIQSIWPQPLKITLANMVWLNALAQGGANPIASESIGSYSVTYAIGTPAPGAVVYPQSIQQGLNLYRRMKFIKAGKRPTYPWEYNDH